MKRVSPHGVFAFVATLVFLATSCSPPTKFSSILDGGFDPVAIFRQHGYSVQNEARGEGIRNAKYGYGWQSWCGVVSSGEKPVTSQAVAVVIRDELNKALGGTSLDELTVRGGASEGQPMTGMLRYNKDRVHGDMHVWLTPGVSNAAICYVIFVREERLR